MALPKTPYTEAEQSTEEARAHEEMRARKAALGGHREVLGEQTKRLEEQRKKPAGTSGSGGGGDGGSDALPTDARKKPTPEQLQEGRDALGKANGELAPLRDVAAGTGAASAAAAESAGTRPPAAAGVPAGGGEPDMAKMMEEMQEAMGGGKDSPEPDKKVAVSREDMKTFLEGQVTNHRFLGYDDKKSVKGSESADQMAHELVNFVLGRIFGTGAGIVLIGTGVLAPLGIAVIIYSNMPNSMTTALKKWISSETNGLIPIDGIPNITDKTREHVVKVNPEVDRRVEIAESLEEAAKKFEENPHILSEPPKEASEAAKPAKEPKHKSSPKELDPIPEGHNEDEELEKRQEADRERLRGKEREREERRDRGRERDDRRGGTPWAPRVAAGGGGEPRGGRGW